ncbi:hypothetical protein LXA43DRAFT_1067340 [Ganoderma leucocontextum]|nr:hypothetical protein LXA43DRAFT_1067340 [Ganoderma leucocontextum]
MCLRLLRGGEGGARVRSLGKGAVGQRRRTAGKTRRASVWRTSEAAGEAAVCAKRIRSSGRIRSGGRIRCGGGIVCAGLGEHLGSIRVISGSTRALISGLGEHYGLKVESRQKWVTGGRAKGRQRWSTRKQAARSWEVVARGKRGLRMSKVHEAIYRL